MFVGVVDMLKRFLGYAWPLQNAAYWYPQHEISISTPEAPHWELWSFVEIS